MSKLSEFLKEKKWRKLKKDQWLILFLAGILLLVIALPTNCGGTDSEESPLSSSGSGGDSSSETGTAEYEEQLEQRLEEVLSRMDGVGEVQVMITFRDGGEAVVEKDTSYASQEETAENTEGEVTQNSQRESSETTVYSSDSDDGAPFVSRQTLPSVEGVLVVAQGGGNRTTAANISEAIEALFGLEVHKIKIVEMNQVQEGSD